MELKIGQIRLAVIPDDSGSSRIPFIIKNVEPGSIIITDGWRMKKISTELSEFIDIIKGNYVYVDKTHLLKNLIESSKQVFLARPRRFGKSLLLKTLKALFDGEVDLFAGLKIAKSDYKFEKFPTLYLNMAMDSDTSEIFRDSLLASLNYIGDSEDITRYSQIAPGAILKDIVTGLEKKYGRKVVILIDEYDYPVSQNINNNLVAKANTAILSGFYSSLKNLESKLRFVMVTGVTRYSMMGLSSGLNHLNDISFNDKFATICGFTPEEMDEYYGDRYGLALDILKENKRMSPTSSETDLRQKILDYYDGYSWNGVTRVLNPWSILYFFEKLKFDFFWLNTAPSLNFLQNIISSNPLNFTPDTLKNIAPDSIANPQTVNDIDLIPFLFYTGYLTIDTIDVSPDNPDRYNLKVPNFEVNNKFYSFLTSNIRTLLYKDEDSSYSKFCSIINNKDSLAFTSYIRAIFSELPPEHHSANESRYHGILWSYFLGLLQDFNKVGIEVPKLGGDLDLFLLLRDQTYVVIEFKYDADDWSVDKGDWKKYVNAKLKSAAKRALRTINNKRYSETFHCQGVRVVEVGVGLYGEGEVLALFSDGSAPTGAPKRRPKKTLRPTAQ